MDSSAIVYSTGSPFTNTTRSARLQGRRKEVKKLSIIIPCYNEGNTISILLDRVLEVKLQGIIEKEVIIVNDCSKDNTDSLIEAYIYAYPDADLKYIKHTYNQGKGAAVKTGRANATGDLTIIQDADLEYNPGEYPLLLEPILTGDADIVYGSRFMGGRPHRILFFWHTLGNKLMTFFSNLFTNMNLTDAHTCLKVVPTELFKAIDLHEDGFAFDAELNVKISKIHRLRIYEVGISYYGRTFADGKKIRLKDAIRSLWCILKYSVRSGRKSVITSRHDFSKQGQIPVV